MNVKEIGGYIELEYNYFPMLHNDAIALNCGTNCLAYLLKSKHIKKIMIPLFLCNCIENICVYEGVEVCKYSIGPNFLPDENIKLEDGEWLYIVNFYGQLSDGILSKYVREYGRVIIDQTHAYFEKPIKNVDTIYTCRKFFGVPDGAFLYTDKLLDIDIPVDESFSRMNYLLGRFERTATEFYNEYKNNDLYLARSPLKKMSKLTNNLLHGIDYDRVKKVRTDNYNYLYEKLERFNQLRLRKIEGAFCYPFLYKRDGDGLRKYLLTFNIYIPTLWPNVLEDAEQDSLEYCYSKNILPIPVDQRYTTIDIQIIIDRILEYIS